VDRTLVPSFGEPSAAAAGFESSGGGDREANGPDSGDALASAARSRRARVAFREAFGLGASLVVYSFEQTKVGYAHLWDQAKVLPAKEGTAEAIARKALVHKDAYLAVEAATGVPWWAIPSMHYREGDLNFGTYLGNGQSLNRPTTEVPAGRGPFSSFQAGAEDALRLEGMAHASWKWTIERVLYWWERFNGQGYFSHGNSPYLWSWTNLYSGGKFTSDHHYDPSVFDVQGGCVAILLALMKLDASIVLTREGAPTVTATVPPTTAPFTLPQFPGLSFPLPQTAPTPGQQPAAPPQGLPISLGTLVSFAATVLPLVATFFPPAAAAIPFIPVLQGAAAIITEIQAVGNDPVAIFQIVEKHIANVQASLAAMRQQGGVQSAPR
jgi:lysozyme family protein